MIFSKNRFFMGGLTFVRTYASQWSKHPHYLIRVGLIFYGTSKSSTPSFVNDFIKILGSFSWIFGIWILDILNLRTGKDVGIW
jgi:hypothetical protein